MTKTMGKRRSAPRRQADRITQRWIKTPNDERAVAAGCRFDEEKGFHVIEFFTRYLRHSKGRWAGEPLELLDWQRDDLIMPLFGWIRPDGLRRFRRAGVWIAKKNGKSTLAAAIGLYLLVADGEQGAEIYSVACDRDQASIVHDEAVRMVKASEDLLRVLTINHTTRNISFAKMNSYYRAMTADADTNEGLNAHGMIIDELHAWRGSQLWDALRYAGTARSQPLQFVISTAGDDPQSIGAKQYHYAKGVLSGVIDDQAFFAYVREARPDDDWKEPSVWRKANPSLGEIFDESSFAEEVKQVSSSPTELTSFKRYRLGIWASSSSPWLDMDHWLACKDQFSAADLRGRECFGGLDLSKTRDMTALVLVFREGETYRLLPWFWLPEDTVRDPGAMEHYRTWARQGLIETTPGGVCDYAYVKRRIRELSQEYLIREIAYDPYNAEQLTQEIEEEFGIRRVLFPQTIVHFAPPTGEFERLVTSGKIRHNGNEILTWQAGNVAVKTDANNNKRPVKPPSDDHRKIDGIVAAIMGLARAMRGQDSIYTGRGLLSI